MRGDSYLQVRNDVHLTVCILVRIILDMKTNEAAAAVHRFHVMANHRWLLPALAWTGLGIRIELAAKSATGGRADKLRGYAAECRGKADRARAMGLRASAA